MSMTFDARKDSSTDGKLVSVFTTSETTPFLYPKGVDHVDFTEASGFENNPAYRYEYDFVVAKSNGVNILRALGYVSPETDHEFFLEIEDFCRRCHHYLDNDDCVIGVYMDDSVQRLLVLVTEGKNRGATHIAIDA